MVFDASRAARSRRQERGHRGPRGRAGRRRSVIRACGGALAVLAAGLTAGSGAVTPNPAAAATTPAASISSGAQFSCAVTSSGGVRCWGLGTSGQLGNSATTSRTSPVDVTGLTSGVASVAAGGSHACAVTTSGGVKCWGLGTSGQLGNGSTASSSSPVDVSGLTSGVAAVALGANHSCAITTAGGVTCWGLGTSGQLGNSATASSSSPVNVTGLTSGVTALGLGGAHSCAINAAGGVVCWGSGTSGQLGNGGSASSSSPVAVTGAASGFTSLAAGTSTTCALATAGSVKCWGLGTSGQLGNGASSSSTTPVSVSGLSDVASIGKGASNTCAVTTGGAATCWGAEAGGQLGDGRFGSSTPTSNVPVDVLGATSGMAAISSGTDHTCALTVTGSARCWGAGSFGQLGGGPRAPLAPAAPRGLSSGVASIAAAQDTTCVRTTTGAARCWGTNLYNLLGNGTASWSIPTEVTGLTSGVGAIATGGDGSCALSTAGAASCWGTGLLGGLGNASFTNRAAPVSVIGVSSGATSLGVGGVHACAVTAAGGVKCWGYNDDGRLGDGGVNLEGGPVDVTGLSSGVAAVAVGGSHACALKATGGVACWGVGSSGQVGNGSFTTVTTPVDVVGLSSGVTALALGTSHSCALTTTGGVKCWGSNTYGQVGYPANLNNFVPQDVTGLTSGVTAIAAGDRHTCAALVSGSVRCWGYDAGGQLGDGTTTTSTTPVTATGVSGVVALAAGRLHTCALKSDGGVVCWGSDASNQLGRGAMVDVQGGAAFVSSLPPAPTISGSRTPAANAAGWNNEPVVVSFTCSSSALASCTSPTTVATDGANQSVTGTAADTYGQSSSATVSGISIDRAPPTLAGLASTSPNAAGWYSTPVTVAWTCDDALSGIAAGACPAPATVTGEGSAVSASASVSDRAGNVTSASSESLRIDRTKPSTGVSSPPTWSSADVTLVLAPVDALSGVASTSYRIDGGAVQSGTAPSVSGQGVHTVSFWSSDVAGNVEEPQTVQVQIDTAAPSITAERSPSANGAGWNRTPVTVTFTCTADGAPVRSCSAPQAFATEVDTSTTGTAVDEAGNEASLQVPVRIDLTAPTIAAQLPAPNAAGWFSAPVSATFSCADQGGSGVATCAAAVVLSAEGAGQPVLGSASDLAGNTASTSGADVVSIDLTPPEITGAVVEASNGSGGWYGPVHVRWTCADSLSGVAACPADQIVDGEGVHVVSASVDDRAGNTASAEVTVRIDHDASQDPGTVHGTLTDASTGQPAPGVTIALANPTTGSTIASTTTGTDGSYVFPLVADGTYKVSATKWGTYLQRWYPTASDVARGQAITVGRGTVLRIDLAVAPGHVIKGTVTGPTGAPVGAATVVLQSGVSTQTDATGRYELKGLASGSYSLQFLAYGLRPATGSASVSGAVSVTTTVDRQLAPQPASAGMKGTITSLSTGGPLGGATVRVWLKGATEASVKATTGSDGRWALPGLPVGDYQVDVVRGDYRSRWAADSPSRSTASVIALTTTCTSAPDLTWGDPCATPVNIRMQRP